MDDIESEMQALITEREGMVSDNMQRARRDESMAYSGEEFRELAERMRLLQTSKVDDHKMSTMTETEATHQAVHEALHRSLDELVADYITQTHRRPSESTVLELMQWSFVQVMRPSGNPVDIREYNNVHVNKGAST